MKDNHVNHGERVQSRTAGCRLPMSALSSKGVLLGEEENHHDTGELSVVECRVLVVDDNPAVLHVTAELFSVCGYSVTKACGPVAAVALLCDSHYQLVLTDYDMPILNGYHLCRRAKLKTPRTRVVIMTGVNRAELEWLLACDEIDGLLFKPVTVGDLNRLMPALDLPNGFSLLVGSVQNGYTSTCTPANG